MDNINEILSSLTDEDMENLRAAAETFFSSQEEKTADNSHSDFSMPDFASILGNAQMMAKISSINKKDDRTRFIEALKPLLSERRRHKADEAMQMMKLFELLPMLTQIMGGEKK